YEVALDSSLNLQIPHANMEQKYEFKVSCGKGVDKYENGKEGKSGYSRNSNENLPWGSDEMVKKKSALWVNME
ncbi:hypothetical protein KI387_033109, partial [Taxus chinensis]